MGDRLRFLTRLVCSFLIITVSFTHATPTNITIDDTHGDEVTGLIPTYTDQVGNVWLAGSGCQGCHGSAQPDASQAHEGTWHDATHVEGVNPGPIVNIAFNGTAVYAYFILANTASVETTNTSLHITLDNQDPVQFTHLPDRSSADYEYNVPVYTNGAIPNGEHTLTITADSISSLLLFDYVLYTTDSNDSHSSSSLSPESTTSSQGPITVSPSTSSAQNIVTTPAEPSPQRSRTPLIGGVVGGISGVLVIMTLVAILLYRRRVSRRRVSTADLQIQTAFIAPFITWTQRAQATSGPDTNHTISSAPKCSTNRHQEITENSNDQSFLVGGTNEVSSAAEEGAESHQGGGIRRRTADPGDGRRVRRNSVDDIRHQFAAIRAQVEELRLMQMHQGMMREGDAMPPPAYEGE